ncbi:hypothetical protein B0H63DRAFT_557869 [Podospora didyma]|uniref:NADPH-dependent diflavin oxidoreductase 1 n=1 Tax=Podospora didyma TaxID=330526 RepID=A0AAE0U4R2_9PEZI|nr:hypothetical protein B0H63DRAFT_557869 [Podospora didyma]
MTDTQDIGTAAKPALQNVRSIAVLYGSESGNAEDMALEIGEIAQRLHFQVTVDEMDGFKLTELSCFSLAIFVTSTTGNGDMPKNTTKFWKSLLRKKLRGDSLRRLKFTTFGLGDSSYQKFNWAARKLRARLLQLGASEIFPTGEADERHDDGLDSVYLPWKERLKAALMDGYPPPDGLEPIPDDVQLPPRYTLQLAPAEDTMGNSDAPSKEARLRAEEEERKFLATRTKSAVRTHIDHPRSVPEQLVVDQDRTKGTFPAFMARESPAWENLTGLRVDSLDADNLLKDYPGKYLLKEEVSVTKKPPPSDLLPIPGTFTARLSKNVRITPGDHWQDVRSLHFDVLDIDRGDFPEFGAGCTLLIYPKNFQDDVQELISLMGWEGVADKLLRWTQTATDSASFIARPKKLYIDEKNSTLRSLFTHNLDITAIPKRSFIKQLVHFTTETMEKERLLELTMPGNEQEYYDYTSRPRRTILELLRDFPGVRIPFQRAIDLFPIIRPREFSLCNGGESLKQGHENVVHFEILVALVEYKTIIRKPRQGLCSRYIKHLHTGSILKLGFKPASNLDIISDDEKAARPVLAIATGTGIAPIRALVDDRLLFRNHGSFTLFFGCRSVAADYYFAHEWEDIQGMRVYPAFSRDPVEPPAKESRNPPPTWPLASPSWNNELATLPGYDPDAGKNYVQHQIGKHADVVGDILRRKPIVVVCGNSGRMPQAVRTALLHVVVVAGLARNHADAEKWFNDTRNLIFWQETW